MFNKVELKKQLQELGIKVEGNYARISKRVIQADDKQTSIYYKADWSTKLDVKKPTIKQRKAYKKPEGWFETEEEAISRFSEVQSIAKERAIEIERELTSLQKRLGFDIGYTMEGDTHGIHEDYLYLCIKVEGYEFILKIEQD